MLDTLKRRVRFAPPAPITKHAVISDRDIRVFEALHTHGPLPTHYLHAFVGGHRINFRHHLRNLFDHGYLTRPAQYFNSYFARYQSIVYDLGPEGQKVLLDRGKLFSFVDPRDDMIHRLMSSCVMASIELACIKNGFEFLSANKILNDKRAKSKELTLPITGEDEKHWLNPDRLAGVRTPHKLRFFSLENGRGGEQRSDTELSRKRKRKTYEGMVKKEADVLANETFSRWGIPNLHFLHAETCEDDADTLRSFVKEHVPEKSRDHFHYKVCEEFATPWRMPPVYEDILEGITLPLSV